MPIHPPKYQPKSNPFGSSIKSRSYSAGSGFRFGFNGKEKENNIIFNEYTFEFRIYNSGLCRFFSTDPDLKRYPWQTSFAYFMNSPISILDFLGLGQPGWMSDDSRKNKREIKKFRRMLNKEDRLQMDKIEKMTNHVEKTRAVDNFISEINDKYKFNPGLYRIYNDDKSTGQNVIMSMTNIWALHVDPKRHIQVFKTEKVESKPLNWERTSEINNYPITFRNNTGNNGLVQAQFSSVSGANFQPLEFCVKIRLTNQNVFSTVIENTFVSKSMNSVVINVPNGAEIQLIINLPQEIIGNTNSDLIEIPQQEEKNTNMVEKTNRFLGEGILTKQTIKRYINGLR